MTTPNAPKSDDDASRPDTDPPPGKRNPGVELGLSDDDDGGGTFEPEEGSDETDGPSA